MTRPSGRASDGAFAVRGARRRVAICGLAGLLGASLFAASTLLLQLVRPDVDWVRDYVSDLANGRLGWVFVYATFAHGLGNIATSVGLRASLERSRLRDWAVFVFCLAGVGIAVGAVVTTDSAGHAPTLTGLLHRSVATASFVLTFHWPATRLQSRDHGKDQHAAAVRARRVAFAHKQETGAHSLFEAARYRSAFSTERARAAGTSMRRCQLPRRNVRPT